MDLANKVAAAKAFCEERGYTAHMTRSEMQQLTTEEMDQYSYAFSTSDPNEMPANAVTWYDKTVSELEASEQLARGA